MNIKLSDVENKRSRNLVRGIISSDAYIGTQKPMEALRKEASEKDLHRATKFLLTSPLTSRIFNLQPFPQYLSDVHERSWFSKASFQNEGAVQLAMLELAEEDLVRWIDSLECINISFISGDSESFVSLVTENLNNFGLSLTILTKIISAKYSLLSSSESFDLSGLLSNYITPRKDLFAAAFDDSLSWEKSYVATRRVFYEHVQKRLKKSYKYLISDIFSFPQSYNRSQVLQAYGRWSTGDALAYLEREAYREKLRGGNPDRFTRYIPASLHRKWETSFSDISLNDIVRNISDEYKFEEYRFFPHAPAWSEYKQILEWRDVIESTMGDRLTGIFPPRKVKVSDAIPIAHTIDDLLPSQPGVSASSIVSIPMDNATCGNFHRTASLMATIDNIDDFIIDDGEKLLALLDATVDVALLLPVEDLKRTLPERSNDRLFTYLRSALLHDAGEGRRAQHALRRALQNIVQQDHNGDIVDFASRLDANCKHVANHLYYTCSEQFLTELYRLYPTADSVAAAQISMHKWFGDAHEESTAVDLARTLELNLRLRAIRGAIDDTRLYVDPLRFQQWALENLSTELRELSSSKDDLVQQVGIPVDTANKLDAVQSDYSRYVSLLNRAYFEFCTNKFYGIDSYVGRRIRHGTLSGVLVDELRPVIDSAIEATQYKNPAFARHLTKWSSTLSKTVDEFGSSYLYIYSKDKPRGMFSAQANAPSRINEFNRMAHHVLANLEPNRPTNKAVKTIYEHCWLLLEVDLKLLRDSVKSLHASLALNAASYTRNLDEQTSRVVATEVRKINLALRERFEMLGEWLTQPTSGRPTASFEQLMRVVLEEVGGRYAGFDPKVDFSKVAPVDLFGHRFHTVYDILFVLVDNAAKHGVRDGIICLEVNPVTSGDGTHINVLLSVSSQIPHDRIESSHREITLRMNSGIDDALIQQGKSGLRKARLLVRDNDEFTNFSVEFNEDFVKFLANLRLKAD